MNERTNEWMNEMIELTKQRIDEGMNELELTLTRTIRTRARIPRRSYSAALASASCDGRTFGQRGTLRYIET